MIHHNIADDYGRIVVKLSEFENIKEILNTKNKQYYEGITPLMHNWYIIQFGEKYGHLDLVYLIKHNVGTIYYAYFGRINIDLDISGKGLSMSMGELQHSIEYGLEEASLYPIEFINQNTFINWRTNPLSSRK